MQKQKVLDYLNNVLSTIESQQEEVSFETSKSELIEFLTDIFGERNKYSKKIESIAAVTFESNDELYVKIVIDEKKSNLKLANSLKNIAQQIELFEADLISKTKDKASEQLTNALQQFFSDTEINQIQDLVKQCKKDKNNVALTDHLRVLETEKRLNLLAEILKQFN